MVDERPIPDGYTFVPQVDWLTTYSAEEAWQAYTFRRTTHGYPVPGTDAETRQPCWRLHPYVGVLGTVTEQRTSMAEFLAEHGPVMSPPSPGGSDKAAKLKPDDRKRISEREARAAAKRRDAAEREAERQRQADSQGSLF